MSKIDRRTSPLPEKEIKKMPHAPDYNNSEIMARVKRNFVESVLYPRETSQKESPRNSEGSEFQK